MCFGAIGNVALKASKGGVPACTPGRSPHLNSLAARRDMICIGSTLNALLLPFVHWPSGTLQIFASTSILVRELGDLHSKATPFW